jgi:hypothetical protein
MNPLRFIGALVTLSGLSFYIRHLFNQGGRSDFFLAIAGASIALTGVWLLLWSVPRDQQNKPPRKCA